MGQTDKYIIPIYKKIAKNYTDNGSVVGMFGFTETDKIAKLWRKMDFYDLRLSNWDINGDWKNGKTYKTIVCLRTSGFARNVRHLLDSFESRLKPGGILFIDWSLGSGHYPRDSKGITLGWQLDNERSYGHYNNKKCYLYSSCITDECLKSDAFSRLCKSASQWYRYSEITNWKNAVTREFGYEEIGYTKDILRRYDIIYEKNWTPLDKNGKFQLYTIQVLKKC